MNIIEQIKNEIERRITDNTFGAKLELIDLLSWLDSSFEEKSEKQIGLEEEIKKYNKERFDEYFPEQDGDFISEVDFMTCLGRVARHFAQWSAEHIAGVRKTSANDLEEAARIYFEEPDNSWEVREVFIAGAKWQAEQDKETIELAEEHAYLAGAVNEREKMMSDAVDGYIERDLGGQLILGRKNAPAGDEFMLLKSTLFPEIHAGDHSSVRIIIVKEN